MSPDTIVAAMARVLEREEFADVQAAFLFGSEAEDRAHAESDVDVAVLLDPRRQRSARERFERRLVLMARLAGATHGRGLDLVVLNDLPPQFARRIVTRGRRFHCSDAPAAHAFLRDVQLRAADLEPFLRRMRRIKSEGLRAS
jgi:hypothetical protein